MNVFILHTNPDKAAKAMCDKHINKMCTEAGQIANTGLHLSGLKEYTFYRPTHKNHPWCKFASKSFDHFNFVVKRGYAIGREFLLRNGSRHKTYKKFIRNWTHDEMRAIEEKLGKSNPEQVWRDVPMPKGYDKRNKTEAYREYYMDDKITRDWCSYDKAENQRPPEWFMFRQT